MGVSTLVPRAPAKCNLLWAWTTITLVFMLILDQLAGGAFALSRDGSVASNSSQNQAIHIRQLTQPPAAVAGAATDVSAALYRPPIVTFKSQGGPVLSKPIHVYIVWYGAWAATEKSVIRTALSSLTPAAPITDFPNLSNLWKVMRKYYGPDTATFVTNNVTIAAEVDDGSTTASKTINSMSDALRIALNHINASTLPADYEQGVYFVLAASDISYFDTNTSYCGYHSTSPVDSNLVYSFVAMPVAPPFDGCNLFSVPNRSALLEGNIPPNHAVSDTGALDSMVSVILHELLELAADPYTEKNRFAWIQNPDENSETGDLCSYNYVAGEWYYCDLQTIYYDFNTSRDDCMALALAPSATDPPRTLTDPSSGVSFNQYGVGGSQFLVQKFWSLDNEGCVLQPEDACPANTTYTMDVMNGTISRGYFFDGVGLQTYAPGQNCGWRIQFSRQVAITFTFQILALAYDNLDYIKLWHNGVLVKTLTGFANNTVVTATGTDFGMQFVTYGGRSPYPVSAGFIMDYTAL